MELRVNGLIKESIVDGPGFRFVVFTQGCPHHCEGCHNPDTHAYDGGYLVDTEDVIKQIKNNFLLDGVTFSGGEPFVQVEPLIEIAKAVHKNGGNVISYSGFTFEQIIDNPKLKPLLMELDILIDGPFILEQRDLTLDFRGSKNQRIIDVKKSLEQNKVIELEL